MRALIMGLAMLFLAATAVAGADEGCGCGAGMGCHRGGAGEAAGAGHDHGPAADPKPGPGHGPGMTAGEHDPIQALLSQHAEIRRKVEEIPGGVRTTTTAAEPALVETLRLHVRQMSRRLERGSPVRMWDPVFRGIFAHHDEITLTYKDIEGGIEVTETSENPEVASLIRAHAAKVNAFVSEGHAAARPPWAGGGRGMGKGMGRGRGRMGRP